MSLSYHGVSVETAERRFNSSDDLPPAPDRSPKPKAKGHVEYYSGGIRMWVDDLTGVKTLLDDITTILKSSNDEARK